MKYKDLKLINTDWLDGELWGLVHSSNLHPQTEYEMIKMKVLEEVKSKLISATPILEKVFREGEYNIMYDGGTNNVDCFEELLNKEVKL